MAIEVRIPKEITEYKEKILFGMSVRQLLCFTSSILLGAGSYVLLTRGFNLTMKTASYVIVCEALPLMAIGFIKINGFDFERYFVLLLRHKAGHQIREYQPELTLENNKISAEGVNQYAWIFEKNNQPTGKGATRKGKKERKADAKRREATVFTVTKAERKKKRKTTLRTIKKAQQEYRAVKRRAKKSLKKTGAA